jgi:hypothetical protein
MFVRNTDKTIPFRLSPAEIASLRVLRNKIPPFTSNQDDEEEDEKPGEINTWNSMLKSASQKVAKNNP